jgi:hypothetical protein
MDKLDFSAFSKYNLLGSIEKASDLSSEKAEFLGIPEESKRQPDLSYFTSIFVSSGFNLNSAYFLPSELIQAKGTIISKPLDLEHKEEKIVGHMYSSAFAYKDGSFFNPDELFGKLGNKVDKMDMNVITASTIYRARFPDVADDVEAGKYKVSMECYYRDFDVIVNDIVIPREEATKVGLVEVIDNVIKIKNTLGEHRVGKVMRNMLFAGCGLVESPANPESIILETAAKNDQYILDLEKVESYMKNKQKKESLTVLKTKAEKEDVVSVGYKEISASFGGAHSHSFDVSSKETFNDGYHSHTVNGKGVPEDVHIYFESDGIHKHAINGMKVDKESLHTHKVYIEQGSCICCSNKSGCDSCSERDNYVSYAIETSPAMSAHSHEITDISMSKDKVGENGLTDYSGVHYHKVTLKSGVELKTLTPSDIIKMKEAEMTGKSKEEAGTGNNDGKPLSTPDICVNFKRFIYDYGSDNPGVPANPPGTPGLVPQVESIPMVATPGDGDSATPQSKLVHENWCSLFDSACPVPGGCAVHPDCYRLVLDRTTKEAVSNYYEKLEENRKKAGIGRLVSSLKKTLGEVSKKK